MAEQVNRSLDISSLSQALRAGDRPALARAITLIESRNPHHKAQADELLRNVLPFAGKARRIGISGVPGVGKSTFIDQFGSMLTAGGCRLAVLAVDPSSNRTLGSILGDKTRMVRLATDRACYVRQSPTGGELGGVAAMTRETIIVCEAAGFDTILVETVGVGQSEHAVADMVDFFLLLMLPGAGDELQGIKKGIVELADMIVVNKADGDNRAAAEQAALHYRRALRIIEPKDPQWLPEIVLTSAIHGSGLEEVWRIIDRRFEQLQQAGGLERLRQQQDLNWLESDYRRQLLRRIALDPGFGEIRREVMTKVANKELAPTQGASQMARAGFEIWQAKAR